jgi:hypothetical protein
MADAVPTSAGSSASLSQPRSALELSWKAMIELLPDVSRGRVDLTRENSVSSCDAPSMLILPPKNQ